jgi:hypothetical protein
MGTQLGNLQEQIEEFRKSLREETPVYDQEAVRRKIKQDVEEQG